MIVDLTKGIHRRIYAGCTTGRRINRVSIGAEVCFWRLHCVCDDFGNLEGEAGWLKSTAFPRRDDVTVRKIGNWIAELEEAKLIELYRVGTEHYIHILNFDALQPAGKNGKRFKRFPAPTEPLSDSAGVNPDLSKVIQSDPRFSNENRAHQDEAETETVIQDVVQDEAEDQAQPDPSVSTIARARFSGSDSFSSRLAGRQAWLAAISPLWAPRGQASQHRADGTSSANLFDESIWPENARDGPARLVKAMAIIRESSGAERRMAYVTSRVKAMNGSE